MNLEVDFKDEVMHYLNEPSGQSVIFKEEKEWKQMKSEYCEEVEER